MYRTEHTASAGDRDQWLVATEIQCPLLRPRGSPVRRRGVSVGTVQGLDLSLGLATQPLGLGRAQRDFVSPKGTAAEPQVRAGAPTEEESASVRCPCWKDCSRHGGVGSTGGRP